MKKLILFLLIFSGYIQTTACGCFPFDKNFYNNLTSAGSMEVGIVILDSVYRDTSLSKSQMAIFKLLEPIQMSGNLANQTQLIVEGTDGGLNCAESFDHFTWGDTLVVILEKGSKPSILSLPYYSGGICGVHYLNFSTIKGKSGSEKIEAVKKQAKSILTSTVGQPQKEQIAIFPNPAPDGVFTISNPEHKKGNIRVIDLSGSVQHYTFNGQAVIRLEPLAKGIYHVEITFSDGDIQRRRLVSMR